MSYTCETELQRYENEKGYIDVRNFPLRFQTESEAFRFGNKMFKPPKSVLSWTVKQVPEPANAGFRNGKVSYGH